MRETVINKAVSDMKSCLGCGTPIPTLDLSTGFNFVCTKCGCETRPQDTFEKAQALWNEGRIFPKNEAEYMSNIENRRKGP